MFAMTANVAGLVQSRANPAARAGIDALGATALVALVAVVVFAALADARIVSALAARVTADIGSVRSRVCGCVATHRDDDARRGERSIFDCSIANTVVRSRVAEGCVRTVYPCAKAIDRPVGVGVDVDSGGVSGPWSRSVICFVRVQSPPSWSRFAWHARGRRRPKGMGERDIGHVHVIYIWCLV